MPIERRLAAVLAADVVGYSRLMERDEAGSLATLKAHRRELIDDSVAEHQGRIVKLVGDGMLVEFPSVVNAVACAFSIQKGMQQRNAEVAPDSRIEFRIGVHLGDVIAEDDDIYGDGVNVAARIEGIAAPGGIAVSGTVREHVANRLELDFEDLGEQLLKNIVRPVRVFAVRLDAPAGAHRADPASSDENRPSVAVLAFTNMSGDPEQEYFSDGIAEDIITDLSKISGLFVVGRNTSFTYKGRSVNLQQVASELRVRYLVEGSVRKSGQRVRINAQLIDGRDGGHLWAERYDRDLTDIFAIQDEITGTIIDQLKVRLLPEERRAIAEAATPNVEAYTHYLRGRERFHRATKPDFAVAKRMFEKAIEVDPNYARAYAGIADCNSFLVLNYDENISIDDIVASSEKALSLDPELAEAHASRGLAFSVTQRFADAEKKFEQAIALNPTLFETHYFYARTCFVQGKMEQAVDHFVKAAEIKPSDYQSVILLTAAYRALGRLDDELSAAREGVERAKREIERDPLNVRAVYLGAQALVIVGEVERAKDWAERALAIDPHDILTQYNLACLYSTVGEIERSLDLLEEMLPHAQHDSKLWLLHDADLAPLHSHPRWQTIERMARA